MDWQGLMPPRGYVAGGRRFDHHRRRPPLERICTPALRERDERRDRPWRPLGFSRKYQRIDETCCIGQLGAPPSGIFEGGSAFPSQMAVG